MFGFPLLSLMIFLPLGGVLFLLLMRGSPETLARNSRAVGLLISLVVFMLALMLAKNFDSTLSGYQFVEKREWLPAFQSYYHLGVDGISLLFILLTTFLTPLAILASWNHVHVYGRDYMIAFLLLEMMMVGTFCAVDFILFYLFFEAVLIPMFLIIGIWGGPNRIYAALKFFLYTFWGSILMLVAIITIYFYARGTSMEGLDLSSMSLEMQRWLWIAFFVSFAVKIPLWPFHTWLPAAHVEAPTAGSIILAGILLKMGGYGFLRISLPFFPEASLYFAPFIFALSIIGVIYTSVVALVQKDMKKLIAYSSVAHMGIVSFGLFTFKEEGLQGALFQMMSHGVVSAALFFCVGILYDRLHTREIVNFGGVVERMPLYAVGFMIFTLAALGLPGTTGFVGEILILLAAFQVNGLLALGLATGMVLGAAYMLWLYRRVVFGPLQKEALKNLLDLTGVERSVMVCLALSVLFFGVYPQPLLKISEEAVKRILEPYAETKLGQKTRFLEGEASSQDVFVRQETI